jgi:type IV secretory pathway VirJ component
MQKILLFISILVGTAFTKAGATDLPVKEWAATTHDKPLLFYISGDGGFNSFSTSLCESLNASGYDIIALNARSYFWDKKTPDETTIAIAAYLESKLNGRKSQQFVLIGYSFGADVTPFIVNRLSAVTKAKLVSAILMGPSTSTDFEIHWTDILGGNKKRDMDVVAEINNMGTQSVTIISGSDETSFPYTEVKLKKYLHEVLPGGHHFEGNTKEVVSAILRHT